MITYNLVIGYFFCLLVGLNRYADRIPEFAQKISNRIRRGFLETNPITRELEEVQGIAYEPDAFRIFGIIDCNILETCTPGAGPDNHPTILRATIHYYY